MADRSTSNSERAGTGSTQEPSSLDRRREKLQTSKAAAAAAAEAVADLDARLDRNSAQTREHEAALQAALDQVAATKKAIKAAGKQKGQLESARKDARSDAARAQQRAAAAEAKYDRAVLADMVQREKNRDLSVHASGGSTDTDAQDATPKPSLATAGRRAPNTARATAARATAARAGGETAPTPDA